MRAAREALAPLFQGTAADFRMAWVFIDMMPTDNVESASESAARLNDPRVAIFHDPNHLLGRAMARRLGWKHHVAWDTYVIYNPGDVWTDAGVPEPDAWFHQLKDREKWEETADADLGTGDWTKALAEKCEADPVRFRTGDDLRIALDGALRHSAAQPLPQRMLTAT